MIGLPDVEVSSRKGLKVMDEKHLMKLTSIIGGILLPGPTRHHYMSHKASLAAFGKERVYKHEESSRNVTCIRSSPHHGSRTRGPRDDGFRQGLQFFSTTPAECQQRTKAELSHGMLAKCIGVWWSCQMLKKKEEKRKFCTRGCHLRKCTLSGDRSRDLQMGSGGCSL